MSFCTPQQEEKPLDIQGHRGARGLAPENSIEAFLMATEMGVKTLELDLVVSKDNKLVVSHEPYFSPDFCLGTSGESLKSDSIINMYDLPYAEILKFDCGSKGNPRFPGQARFTTVKPLLEEVIDTVEYAVKRLGRAPIYYNIELKTTNKTDSIFHPTPHQFSDLVYELISSKNIWERVNIQSFDFRTLQYFHSRYPEVKLALLIENELDWNENIDSLGFTPEIYSCYFELLNQVIVSDLQSNGMEVIPWTVNEVESMQKMLQMEVDGIITDYPDRALTLINTNE